MRLQEYFRKVIGQPKLLSKIQESARKAGLDKITETEIDAEINAYRKSKKKI